MSSLAKHLLQLVGIAKTWAMANLPGWSDDSHRDVLAMHGGRRRGDKISALTMTAPQLSAVLADYERRGWPRQKPAATGSRKRSATPPDIAHIVRLWGRLGDAGLVANASRQALLAWCSRQLEGRVVVDLDTIEPAGRQRLIEGLKAWLARG